jgi:cell division septation protein DedD
MVVIFGVVFVLGFELGRNQYGGQVRAATEATEVVAPASTPAASAAKSGAQPAAPPSSVKAKTNKSNSQTADVKNAQGDAPPADYDFYKLGQTEQPAAHLSNSLKSSGNQPVTNKSVNPAGAVSAKAAPPKGQPAAVKAASSQPSAPDAPLIPRGSFVLQVAALTKESDALALAQALDKKRFPAFVLTPGVDRFYHVQVGPYADAKSADAARKALEDAGFKAIVKH